MPSGVFDQARRKHQEYYDSLLKRPQGGPNPYKVHAELGRLMTKSATVVRHNDDMRETYAKVCELQQQAARCSISDTSPWANQTAPFARALEDMFPVAKAILQGAIARDESPGAHYKPEFALTRDHGRRAGPAAPRGGGLVRPFRGEQPQVAEVDDCRLRRRRRAGAEL